MFLLSRAECVAVWEEDKRTKRKSATQMFLCSVRGCRNNPVAVFPFKIKPTVFVREIW